MNFCHLHAHSTYSILDAWGQPDQIAERVAEAGLPAHALTDHDSTSGHWKFQKEMLARGLRPIFGVEIRVVDNLAQREWKGEDGRRFYPYHLGLLARNAEGYQNLMRLVTLAWEQGMGGRGKYMPVVTWSDLSTYSAGLTALSGCISGKVSRAILGQLEGNWRAIADEIAECFTPGEFYLEWQNLNLENARQVAEVLSPERNAVVTHDVHFPTQDKRVAQNIMSALMRWKKVVGADGQGPMDEGCYLATAQEVWDSARDFGVAKHRDIKRAMANTWEIAERCRVELPQMEMVRFPYDGDKQAYLHDLVNAGWHKRGLNQLPPGQKQIYLDRVRYEIDIIEAKDYVDYFLIIADICQFCIREDIMKGPGRGSSAGSLAAWLLEITEVDPIEHGLVFERFIDLNRSDLPDIDLDFPDRERERIHEYLRGRYGEEYVAAIGTFTTFKAKAALDSVARVYEIPHWVPNKIKPYIPDRAHGDVRSDMTLVDSIDSFEEVAAVVEQFPDMRLATLLEGQFRAMGIHPAGVVVSSRPIEEVAPIYSQPGKGRVVGLDGWDIESAGLLKVDVLAITGLNIVQDARDAVRANHGINIDFYNLALDDAETMRGFTEVDLLGIFQFNGKATKNTLRQIKPTQFSELVDINTLSRPGAMLAGTTDDYVSVHLGRAPRPTIHPIVDRLTADTYGCVIYQEQVIRIMREFGGLSWAQAGEIRKFLSKRMGMEILEQFRDQFVAGAAKQGIDEATAIDVWMQTSTFGAYGFNKSHSVCYAMLAYWQMYLKRHFPIEFYYAVLANEGDVDTRNLFINEAKRKGVPFLPVHPNRSARTFSLESGGIRYGLTQIRGIGDRTAEALEEARPFKSWEDLLKIPGIGSRTVEVFREAFRSGDDLFELETQTARLIELRAHTEAIGIRQLMQRADRGLTSETIVAGFVISRNYRQEEKLATQAKSSAAVGAKSDTVILYIRDEEGESFPVVVPGWLGNRKTKEIWEAEKDDIYLIRGRLPEHGKFLLATGIANTRRQEEDKGASKRTTEQPQLTFR